MAFSTEVSTNFAQSRGPMGGMKKSSPAPDDAVKDASKGANEAGKLAGRTGKASLTGLDWKEKEVNDKKALVLDPIDIGDIAQLNTSTSEAVPMPVLRQMLRGDIKFDVESLVASYKKMYEESKSGNLMYERLKSMIAASGMVMAISVLLDNAPEVIADIQRNARSDSRARILNGMQEQCRAAAFQDIVG